MAIWQFDCGIIPTDNQYIDVESDEIYSWEGKNISELALEKIAKVLPLSKSWSSDIKQYGNSETTCIKLLLEEAVVEEVSMRLDLRSLDKETVALMIDFIKEVNGKLLYEKRVYDADLATLIQLLKESDAGKFCINPEEYLSNLSSENRL